MGPFETVCLARLLVGAPLLEEAAPPIVLQNNLALAFALHASQSKSTQQTHGTLTFSSKFISLLKLHVHRYNININNNTQQPWPARRVKS